MTTMRTESGPSWPAAALKIPRRCSANSASKPVRQPRKGAKEARTGENKDIEKPKHRDFCFPAFFADDLNSRLAGPVPFQRSPFAPSKRSRKARIEDLRNALSSSNAKRALSALWDFAATSRLAELSTDDLCQLVSVARKSPIGHEIRIGWLLFHELLEVRKARIHERTFLAGMQLFATQHPETALYVLAIRFKQSGTLSPAWASWAVEAYLALNPAENYGMAARILTYCLRRLGPDHPRELQATALADMIRKAPTLDEAKYWHRIALKHYGFSMDPLSTRGITGRFAEKEFDSVRGLFDSRLGMAFARFGMVEECHILVDRYDGFPDTLALATVKYLRAAAVMVHVQSGNLELAKYLFQKWGHDEQDLHVEGLVALMEALAAQGRKEEAMRLFADDVPRLSTNGAAKTMAFSCAIRISHPDSGAIRDLLAAMTAQKIRISKKCHVLYASSLLNGSDDLWKGLNAAPCAMPPNYLFQALTVGDNLEYLPRIWTEVVDKLITGADSGEGDVVGAQRALVAALTPDPTNNHLKLLRSEELKEFRLMDGRTCQEWADFLEQARKGAISRLKIDGMEIPALLEVPNGGQPHRRASKDRVQKI